MTTNTLPDLHLSPGEPLQQQIYRQLVSWIVSGRLSPGDRLPASRHMSQRLAVSRNTVSAVLDQLKAEGYIVTQVGRGSFVADDLPVTGVETLSSQACLPKVQPQLSSFAESMSALSTNAHNASLPFTPGIPDLEAFPKSTWNRLNRKHQDRTRLMGYESAQGHAPLRTALSHYLRLSRGVRCTPDQILITQGAQQAIALCAQLLLNEGDHVLHEDPGYRGASKAFAIRQAHILSVPLKDQALDVDWLINMGEKVTQARLLYTCPTHQYPMGGLLSASARLALLEWSAKHKVWLIEDDYDSEFHFLHKPVAAMQGMTAWNNVIYMGSFSKTLFPALRLGYLVLPETLVDVFTAAKEVIAGETPRHSQAVVADFIEEGHFARHFHRMRQLYKSKWQEMAQRIQSVLGDRVQLIAESAGMHLVLDIPAIDDIALSTVLKHKGFGSSPLSTYYLSKTKRTGLVLGFANSNEAERAQLVACLDQLLPEYNNNSEKDC